MNICDIIRLARRIVSESGCIVARRQYVADRQMLVDPVAEGILSSFTPDLIGVEMRVVAIDPVFQWMKTFRPELEIRVQAVDGLSAGHSVYGFVAIEGDVANVVYPHALNRCWSRFAVLKELMHLCLDSNWMEGGEMHPVGILEGAIDARSNHPGAHESLDDETAALFLAFEVIVPWELRSQLAMMRGLGASNMQIAKAFLVPVRMVEFFGELSREGMPYWDLSSQINARI